MSQPVDELMPDACGISMSTQLNGRFLPAELYGLLPAERCWVLPAKLYGILPAEHWRTHLPAQCADNPMPDADTSIVSDEGA